MWIYIAQLCATVDKSISVSDNDIVTSQAQQQLWCLQGNQHVKKSLFRQRHNTDSDVADVTCCSRLFQTKVTSPVPQTHNRFGDRSFAVAGPRLCNSLLISLRQISSYGQFRRYHKNHLFGIWEITAQCDAWFSALYEYSYLLTYLQAVETRKARLPIVGNRVRQTISNGKEAEHRQRRASMSAGWLRLSTRYISKNT